jgi:hypothetical protein
MTQPENENNYARLWKMRTLFNQLNDACPKFCNLSKYLAVDEVTELFKGTVIF